ncbi:MAG: hypothetical protein ACLP7P_02345 [Rhodomicrobium sp.]
MLQNEFSAPQPSAQWRQWEAAGFQCFLRQIERYRIAGLDPALWESEFAGRSRRAHNAWLERCHASGADPRLWIATTIEEGEKRLRSFEAAIEDEERNARRSFRMRLAESRGELPSYMDLYYVLRETEDRLKSFSSTIAKDLRHHKPSVEGTIRARQSLEAKRAHVLKQMRDGYPNYYRGPDIPSPNRTANAARLGLP